MIKVTKENSLLEERGLPVNGAPAPCSNEEYVARQIEWATHNNVKVGTKVRVTKTTEDNEDGWDNVWVRGMDKRIGKTGTVVGGIKRTDGICIEFEEGTYVIRYYYPFFVLEVVKDKYVPVEKFETGKWYVCHLNKRPSTWNSDGKMDGLLDGKPHKCVTGNETTAEFKGIPLHGGAGWSIHNTIDYFEEVPAPSSEVDWEKKYAELEKKYNKIKDIAVEYMVRLDTLV